MVRRFVALAVTAAVFALYGCAGSGTTAVEDPEIRFVAGSADGGLLQFRMDDVVAADNLAYGGSNVDFDTFEFKDTDPDGYDVSLHDAGSSFEFERRAIQFNQVTDSVVIAHGVRNFAAGEELKRLRISNFTVNRTAPVGNKSRLYVFHGIERAPGFLTPSVKFQNASVNPQFITGEIQPGAVEAIQVDSGTATWFVRRTGTQADFVSQSLTLAPGAIYVVLLSGIEADADPAKQPKITLIQLTTEI